VPIHHIALGNMSHTSRVTGTGYQG
jgi:hypothetical protein